MENIVMSNDNTGLTCSGPDDAWPIPRKYALYTAAIIFLLGMFDLISRQVIVSLFPHIKEEFALSDKQLGMLVASVNVAISLLVVPTAYLVDKDDLPHGRRMESFHAARRFCHQLFPSAHSENAVRLR